MNINTITIQIKNISKIDTYIHAAIKNNLAAKISHNNIICQGSIKNIIKFLEEIKNETMEY